MEKKKWVSPKLIVLVRQPEELILQACKAPELATTLFGPNDRNQGCNSYHYFPACPSCHYTTYS